MNSIIRLDSFPELVRYEEKTLMFDTENNYLYIKPNECVNIVLTKMCRVFDIERLSYYLLGVVW